MSFSFNDLFYHKHGMKELMAYIYISLLFLLIHTCVLKLRMLQSQFVHKCFNVFFFGKQKVSGFLYNRETGDTVSLFLNLYRYIINSKVNW